MVQKGSFSFFQWERHCLMKELSISTRQMPPPTLEAPLKPSLRSHDTSVVMPDEMPLNQRVPPTKGTHPLLPINRVFSV